eukprot:jgi/Chlat1/1198/Chrsp115S00740
MAAASASSMEYECAWLGGGRAAVELRSPLQRSVPPACAAGTSGKQQHGLVGFQPGQQQRGKGFGACRLSLRGSRQQRRRHRLAYLVMHDAAADYGGSNHTNSAHSHHEADPADIDSLKAWQEKEAQKENSHYAAEAQEERRKNDPWSRIQSITEQPWVKRIMLSFSVANITYRISQAVATLMAFFSAQSVSLPLIAPLVFTVGIALRTLQTNASVILPRLGSSTCILWILWFLNTLAKKWIATMAQGHVLSPHVAQGMRIGAEVAALAVAIGTVLSTFGVNVYSLLLPAAVALALGSKDVCNNLIAGFFLIVAEPFRSGDKITIATSAPGLTGVGTSAWFQGVCESVDLRYTVLRDGKKRLYVPNAAFMQSEFVVEDSYIHESEKKAQSIVK